MPWFSESRMWTETIIQVKLEGLVVSALTHSGFPDLTLLFSPPLVGGGGENKMIIVLLLWIFEA